jgi:hypothetical protein
MPNSTRLPVTKVGGITLMRSQEAGKGDGIDEAVEVALGNGVTVAVLVRVWVAVLVVVIVAVPVSSTWARAGVVVPVKNKILAAATRMNKSAVLKIASRYLRCPAIIYSRAKISPLRAS